MAKIDKHQLFHVDATDESVCNRFGDAVIPQNPCMAPNGMNGAHQDSWCTESVPFTGPTSGQLSMIRQHNPYGFTPIMGCNQHGQMVGMCLMFVDQESQFNLVVFDEDCKILSATPTGTSKSLSFAGGYFYLDQNCNAVAVGNGCVQCFPTGNPFTDVGYIKKLEPLWRSDSIVDLVDKKFGNTNGNKLYANLPVWKEPSDDYILTWCLMAGKFDHKTKVVLTEAAMALVKITTSGNDVGKTELLDVKKCDKQWNNNTFTVTKTGAIFVTNGGRMNESDSPADSYIWKVSAQQNKAGAWSIHEEWKSTYENCGLIKKGQTNIGCGTTPTIFDDGAKVAITDNASPQINVVVYDTTNGKKLSQTPVFPKMRSANEASLIGVEKHLVVENNFGHATGAFFTPQTVANEPGMAMLKVSDQTGKEKSKGESPREEIIWESSESFLAMTMLARKSGIIFATTGDWSGNTSCVDGAMYYMIAKDSYDGRIIWRLPMGAGKTFAHDYGGIYFNRLGNKIYVGTNDYIICIKNTVH